jgi:hypothetical protein
LRQQPEVVRKGDDAKAHKELNQLGGDGGGDKEMDTGKAESALSKVLLRRRGFLTWSACCSERLVLMALICNNNNIHIHPVLA